MRRTRRLGRYHLTYRIAFGGMAELFRAFTFDDVDGHQLNVAIKRLLPHFREDKSFVDMLTDEFKLVSYLKHPNIAEVYELVELDDALIISMEYVDGKDLRSTVEKAKEQGLSLALDDVVYVVARSLEGLHHAHVARDPKNEPLRIVHRDFSPSNVLLGYDGTVKLCDFGIAKATHNRIQTKTGIIKGKVKYMSPEQAFGRKLDWRSDVFSAGSVLYELSTHQAPFSAPNEIDLIFAVREANPTPAREVNPAVPEALAKIIEKAMARSRSARFQSALEFRNALLTFLRRYNPSYRRNKLAQFMKRVWRDEIERELRAMEDYVVDVSAVAPADLGKNLIAGALGPDAPFSRFSPSPTRSTAAKDGANDADDAVHHAKTEILDARAQQLAAAMRPRPPAPKSGGRPGTAPPPPKPPVGSQRPPPPPRVPPPPRAARPATGGRGAPAGDPNDPIHNEKTVVADPRRGPPR
ncbi:serine/threonine protein kinase [Sandaracinus amylolyticus]|uniref:serine/threonine protein kinase n=1 Tax=Sandaracinus amylolyticus TaxID=927083 RepID=UPI001F32C94A|nr:serine/threonine-protein kinase [Sandaracinus amylolyticus]UJR80378.1 Serine/threonine protein kinase [Sandaracinus amylolyticus]